MESDLKKLKNEVELVKEAIRVGDAYAQKRGVGKFEGTDSSHDKVAYIYRLLVHDKLIQPLAKGEDKEKIVKSTAGQKPGGAKKKFPKFTSSMRDVKFKADAQTAKPKRGHSRGKSMSAKQSSKLSLFKKKIKIWFI